MAGPRLGKATSFGGIGEAFGAAVAPFFGTAATPGHGATGQASSHPSNVGTSPFGTTTGLNTTSKAPNRTASAVCAAFGALAGTSFGGVATPGHAPLPGSTIASPSAAGKAFAMSAMAAPHLGVAISIGGIGEAIGILAAPSFGTLVHPQNVGITFDKTTKFNANTSTGATGHNPSLVLTQLTDLIRACLLGCHHLHHPNSPTFAHLLNIFIPAVNTTHSNLAYLLSPLPPDVLEHTDDFTAR